MDEPIVEHDERGKECLRPDTQLDREAVQAETAAWAFSEVVCARALPKDPPQSPIETLNVSSIDHILEVCHRAIMRFQRTLWYRGHSDASWALVPSVYRSCDPGTEPELANAFRLSAVSRCANPPRQDDLASWLSLMRHHGLPTRLLDWSESPLVAAHFAIDYDPKDVSGAIWVLSPSHLNETVANVTGIPFMHQHEACLRLISRAFGGKQEREQPKVVATLPPEDNDRIRLQQGRFTIHDVATPLEQLENTGSCLMKLVISPRAKHDIGVFLRILGIRRSSLFSDLEHLAWDITTEKAHAGRSL
jgi:hypothetical protein